MHKAFFAIASAICLLAVGIAATPDANAFSAQKSRMSSQAERFASGCTIVDDRGHRHRMTNGQTVRAVDQAPMLKKYNQCSCPSATHKPVVKEPALLACVSDTLITKRAAKCDCAPKANKPIVVDARVIQSCETRTVKSRYGASCPKGYTRRSGGEMGACNGQIPSTRYDPRVKVWALCVKYERPHSR